MSDFMKGLISGEELRKLEEEGEKVVREVMSEEKKKTPSVEIEIDTSNALVSTDEKNKKWQPTEWRPEYQMVVTLSLMNFSGEQIVEIMGEKYNYSITRQHVYNILNCDKAKEILSKSTQQVAQITEATIESMLAEAEILGGKRILQMLKDDSVYMKHPFLVVDRAIRVLEGRAKLKNQVVDFAKNNSNTNNQNNFFFANLPEEVQKRIERGMNRTALVEELHGPTKDARDDRVREERSGTDG